MQFRPEHDPRRDSPVEWEDNALSNALAWASYRVTPRWCQTEDHWTSRVAQNLFTDCPCCLLFRGVVLGIAIALLPVLIATLAFVIYASLELSH